MSGFIINPYRYANASVPLLDTYTGAVAAYSMRRLKATANNPARVRRSSDNAEQDMTFSGNEADYAALLSFLGANSGFVKNLYDQSPSLSRHLVNTTTTQQPKIVNAGATITDGTNSRGALQFDSDDKLSFANFGTDAGLSGNAAFSAFIVHRKTTGSAGCAFGWGDTGTSLGAAGLFDDGSTAGLAFAGGNNFNTSVPTNNTLYLTSIFKPAGAISGASVYRNGVSVGTSGHSGSNPNIAGNQPLNMGYWANFGTNKFQGNILELIIFASDKSTDRVAIETDMNGYFGIF